jgi:hypothetical protein
LLDIPFIVGVQRIGELDIAEIEVDVLVGWPRPAHQLILGEVSAAEADERSR